ncbi:MAG: tetratricopeptide repeat protein [Pyrinomonadaceae bacterium]
MRILLSSIMVVMLSSVIVLGQADSFPSILESARQGSLNAQNEVGIMYSEGDGVRPNQRKAVYWFRKSAEGGYPLGACNLGLHYGFGWGVPKNKTLLMKWVFIAHLLDGLKCHPADYIEHFKVNECQIEKGWELGVAWMRTHPDLKNSFDERPWMETEKAYPVTVREHGGSTKLPIKRSRKCK